MLNSFHLLVILVSLPVTVIALDEYSRNDFPPAFVFGSGTSAYQVEGATDEDGRTPSIWDTFAHSESTSGASGASGDVACDEYHKYKEDVQLMVETGLEAHRFSISWPRLLPNGRGPVNPKGLQYYNNLIDGLISGGIQPHATLHHYDLPQALEDEYGGWISRKSIKDFTAYANVCFREFGDRVKHWTTLNEVNAFSFGGYDYGFVPPGRCSPPFGRVNCSRGNSSTEPYMAAHNMLLAHASAARLYKEKYKAEQHGFIGICIFSFGLVPSTDSEEDAVATQRAKDFQIGWILHPLVYGDYPDTMKKIVGSRLPEFTDCEVEQVKGAFDFLGVIHYLTAYVEDNSVILKQEERDYDADMAVKLRFVEGASPHEYAITPWGLERVLEYIKQAYGNPPVYILENGQVTLRNPSLEDTSRVKYLHSYIGAVLDALRNGSDIRGYFQWSFLDLFELLGGYDISFGLYYVDLQDPDLKRYPKRSAHWYSSFLKGRVVSSKQIIELEKKFPATSHGHFSL